MNTNCKNGITATFALQSLGAEALEHQPEQIRNGDAPVSASSAVRVDGDEVVGNAA